MVIYGYPFENKNLIKIKMKIPYFIPLILLSGLVSAKNNPKRADYPIQGVPFNEVQITDHFWLPKIEIARTVTIPASFAKCEETGRVNNFVKAANKEGSFGTEYPFDDTDIYKIIEGASYSMSVHPDPKTDRYVDSLITIIGRAQEPDGYLYTARTIDPLHPHKWSGNERWIKESVLSHELYNSGHLFEAAAAHFQSTGKRNFLDIALKNAELLIQVFTTGKRDDAPGHEIVEMGLVKLYRITGRKKYLDLAKYFIDSRGKKNDPKMAYSQDHMPLIAQDEAVGHAVRAGYLYSGVADVAALTGNQSYLSAIDKIWENMVSKKMYLTGGIGSRHKGEAFGDNYELPNLTAYNETCAAIANVYWNYRMFLLHGESKYIDVLERTLYNGVISGIGLDGKTFFYPNPLECDLEYKFNSGGKVDRQPWFGCSCCPTNMCRFLPSVPGYVYAQGENCLYVNLFTQSSATVNPDKKSSVKITQETRYPWDGEVKITVSPRKTSRFAVYLRIPGWAGNQPVPGDLYSFATAEKNPVSITVNGTSVNYESAKGYAVINREWNPGDVVHYSIPMTIHQIEANRKVIEDTGKVALERGPIVYCLEEIDNRNMEQVTIGARALLTARFDTTLLNGVETITGHDATGTKNFTAIPYFAWNNRGASRMKVWIPIK
jgi:DUF1680 family protein